MNLDKRWYLEVDGRLFVLGLISQGNQAEIHFGHADAHAEDDELLSFDKCQCSAPVKLFRWLLTSLEEAVNDCQSVEIQDLWFQVFDEDGLKDWRKESANKLLYRLPQKQWDWIESHVWIGC